MRSTTFIFAFSAYLTISNALPLSLHGSPAIHARFAQRQAPSNASSIIPVPSSTSAVPSATTTSSQPSQSASADVPIASGQPAPSDSSTSGTPKYVVAHHMVGNTFPYTQQDWADDIVLAHNAGIDGFALNIGSDDWEPQRVADAYAAASAHGNDFKLFLSLDMSSLPCASPNDGQNLRSLVSTYLTHPAQLQYHGRAFVSTFAGESCSFGAGSVPSGWASQFAAHPDLAGKIYFVPSFFVDPATFGTFADVMDGDFNFNSGWPIQVTEQFAAAQAPSAIGSLISAGLSAVQSALAKFVGATDTDKQHRDALSALPAPTNGKPPRAYMGAVSPWFFTHYGKDSFNKNFIYLTDEHLYSTRWESIIAARDDFDIVEIVTWNDYGESHYIGPIKGSQPNSQAWVDGMNHTAWLDMTAYYAAAYKTGQAPEIQNDQLFMWARTHPGSAQAPDPVGPPTNFQITADTLWTVVMTPSPATVILSTSGDPSPAAGAPGTRSFDVPAGVTKLALPLTAGAHMYGRIERGGQTVVEAAPDGFAFNGSPSAYNFNAFAVSASAAS